LEVEEGFLFVINVMVAGGECLEWRGFDSVRKKISGS
jgi:hypothetical protein